MVRDILDFMNGTITAQEMIAIVFAFAVVLLVAFPIHECAHAVTAKFLGDDTAYLQGRVTLNPLAHLDFLGTIFMLLCGIGWAKPVPVNPVKCRKTSAKAAMAITSAAGPLSNILLAFIFMIIMKIFIYSVGMGIVESVNFYIYYALLTVIELNLYLGVFNMLPIPPFDGSRIFLSFLPTKTYFKIMKYEQVIMIVVLALMWTGILSIPLQWLTDIIYQGLHYATCFIELIFGMPI